MFYDFFEEKEPIDFRFNENPLYDSFTKEFISFCIANNLEDKAVELLDQKIKEKKKILKKQKKLAEKSL